MSRAKGLVAHTVLLHELQRIGTACVGQEHTSHTQVEYSWVHIATHTSYLKRMSGDMDRYEGWNVGRSNWSSLQHMNLTLDKV